MNIRTAAVTAFVIAAAAVPGTARDRNQVPEAIPDGEPVSCLRTTDIQSSHVRSDSVIDFETRARKFYRVTLPQGGCPGLGFEERFSYTTTIAQLCSTDIITVLYSSPPQTGASCGLSEFQPIKLVAHK